MNSLKYLSRVFFFVSTISFSFVVFASMFLSLAQVTGFLFDAIALQTMAHPVPSDDAGEPYFISQPADELFRQTYIIRGWQWFFTVSIFMFVGGYLTCLFLGMGVRRSTRWESVKSENEEVVTTERSYRLSFGKSDSEKSFNKISEV